MQELPVLNQPLTSGARRTVEGIARVVAVEGERAWLEPEQSASCGSCAASAHCAEPGAPGIGTIANRIAARRFALPLRGAYGELRAGDRLVVGVANRSLLRAALLAYGLPLVAALTAGAYAQESYGEDAMTMLGMACGLAGGLLIARFGAHRLAARGELTPHYLRRALPGESCATPTDSKY